MKFESIESYLAELKGRLWWQGPARARILEELASHLNEAVEAGLECGLSLSEAQAQALQRFGPSRRVAAQFERQWSITMQKILLAAGLAGGLFCAYVDSRPTWDDAGILAFAMLIFSGLLCLAGFRRPWLLGLAVGGWIPLYGILVSHNFGSLLALGFALVGAYAGWGVRRLVGLGEKRQIGN